MAERNRLRTRVAGLTHRNESLTNVNDALTNTNGALTRRNQTLNKENDTLKNENDVLRSELHESQNDYSELVKRLEDMRARYASQSGELQSHSQVGNAVDDGSSRLIAPELQETETQEMEVREALEPASISDTAQSEGQRGGSAVQGRSPASRTGRVVEGEVEVDEASRTSSASPVGNIPTLTSSAEGPQPHNTQPVATPTPGPSSDTTAKPGQASQSVSPSIVDEHAKEDPSSPKEPTSPPPPTDSFQASSAVLAIIPSEYVPAYLLRANDDPASAVEMYCKDLEYPYDYLEQQGVPPMWRSRLLDQEAQSPHRAADLWRKMEYIMELNRDGEEWMTLQAAGFDFERVLEILSEEALGGRRGIDDGCDPDSE